MLNDSAKKFEQKFGVRFVTSLGEGKDGFVLKTEQGNAVKFVYNTDVYNRELSAYRVLNDAEIDKVNGHEVPRLCRFDDDLRAIEMTIVAPPFLLDFAAAYTEEEVERFAFDDDVVAEREMHWAEIFGEKWPDVVALRQAFLERTGLILLDLSLNNIRFA